MKRIALSLCWLLCSACITTGDPPAREAFPEEAARHNLQLGSEYLQRGDRERALEKLRRAVDQDPQSAPAHAYLALTYEQLGRNDEAERHYRTAVKVGSDDANVRNMYAVYLCRHDRFEEAEKQFLAAAGNPAYGTPETAFTNAGLCALQKPDRDAAEAYFRRALNINSRYPAALWQMARLSFENDYSLQARAFLQRYDEVSSMSAEALWLGVQVEHVLEDDRAAQGYGDELLSKFPESVEARLLTDWRRNGRSF